MVALPGPQSWRRGQGSRERLWQGQRCGAAEAVPSCGFGDTRHQRVLAGEPPHAGVSQVSLKQSLEIRKSARCFAPLADPCHPQPGRSSPQMMTAPIPSPPTKWPGCIATWIWCTSAGARARSPRPSQSLPWSRGRRRTPSASTGCLPSAVSSMRGKGRDGCDGRDGLGHAWGPARRDKEHFTVQTPPLPFPLGRLQRSPLT